VFAVFAESSFAIPARAVEPRESDGSEAAARVERFQVIFGAHYDFVWRTVRRLGVADAGVDDAVQEVFVVVARKLGEIEVGMEKSFLFGTARRIAAAARRAKKSRGEQVPEEALHDRPAEGPNPEEALGTRRAQEMLVSILDGMENDVREAFVLFELEGLSKSEVAQVLAIPEGTAASRLRRGRELFLASAQRMKAKMEGARA